MERKPRLLVFVIAYQAESTLRQVLERIPAAVFRDNECEVLVVDDASADRTFAIGHQYRSEHPEVPLTVLRNEYNQGYGGNQKVGYAYATAEGFDFVAMVHGDAQYAPEELPNLLQPLREGRADAVFGSRMMTRFGALKGGMPLYKYVGNKVLTAAQNRMLGTRLSEFHSGYRVYGVKALRAIHYELNSNDFHFDTEIIIQLFNGGMRIVELPIPTYYGNEICRVDGVKYAKDVFLATLKNVFHRVGLLYQRRFDPKTNDNQHYDLKLGYPSSHSWALAAVPDRASVIDIGSGPGGLARELVRKGCKVTCVDQFPTAHGGDIEVVQQDLDDSLRFDIKPHRYILLLDIIEHLRDPERFIERLRRQFDYQTRTVVISTPNIAFFVVRFMLLLGQFNYGRAGILDRSHTRLFTFRGVEHLLRDAGFRVKRVRGVPAPFPKVVGNRLLGRLLIGLNLALIRFSKTLFAYQIFAEAETTPDVEFLLADAKRASAARSLALHRGTAVPPEPPRAQGPSSKAPVPARQGEPTAVRRAGAGGALVGLAVVATLAFFGVRRALGYDDFWHVFIARQDTWSGFWQEVRLNAHPPIFYLLLRSAAALLGSSLLAYRAVSIVAAGTAAYLFARVAARVTGGAAFATVAAAAFALSTCMIEIGNDVRAYATSLAFLLLALGGYLDWLGARPGKATPRARATFAVGLCLALLTHYSSFFFLGATLVGPLALIALHPRWRVKLQQDAREHPLALAAMFGLPAGVAAITFWVHVKGWSQGLNHVSDFMYQRGAESVPMFLARNSARLGRLFLPSYAGAGSWSLALSGLALGCLLLLAARRDARGRLTMVPFVLLFAMLGANMVGALVGRYPYGGELRHEIILFPMAVLCLFAGLERARRALSLGQVPWAAGAGLVVAATLLAYLPRAPYEKAPLFEGQIHAFRDAVGKAPAVFVDQFNFIALFSLHHDWRWQRLWQAPAESMWQVWDVSKEGEHFVVCRERDFQSNLGEAPFYYDLSNCMSRARTDRVASLRVQHGPLETTWRLEKTAELARNLAAPAGLQPDVAVVQGRDVYMGFRARRREEVSLRIADVEATYGGNCRAVLGNATSQVRIRCRGASDCAFRIDTLAVGDPAPGCAKDFVASWTCEGQQGFRSLFVEPEAGFGGSALLTCAAGWELPVVPR